MVLGAFVNKVERRIDATRGLFISMAVFRPKAVDLYRRAKQNRVVLMDGADIAWILEGRCDFVEALRPTETFLDFRTNRLTRHYSQTA